MDNAEQHQPPPPGGDGSQTGTTTGPRVSTEEMRDVSRLRRSVTDQHIAGVAGGLARHLDIDPILVRVAFVVTAFFGGAGILLYVAAWVLVPEEGSDESPLGLDERSRVVALLGVGVLALLAAVGDWAGAFWFPWPVALLAVGVLWFLNRSNRSAPVATPYSAPYAGTAPYTDPVQYADPSRPYGPPAQAFRPPSPRRRGPVLLWFTLALVALAEGVLGVVDLAGGNVVDSAYPALALAIIAAMLVLGSFWGRAGGLILVGLVAAAATGVATAAAAWDEQDILLRPGESSEVRSQYELRQGALTLDLSGVDDVDSLDGRTIAVDGGVGRIVVIVPDGVDASVSADVGVGAAELFGSSSGGLGVSRERSHDGGDDVPDLRLEIDMGVGEVVVREQSGDRR